MCQTLHQVVRGSLNYAIECMRRGHGWTKTNTFTKRMEFKYVTVSERERLLTSWEDIHILGIVSNTESVIQ